MEPVRRQIDTAGLAAFLSLPWIQPALVNQGHHYKRVPGITCLRWIGLPGRVKRFLKPLPVHVVVREGPRDWELAPFQEEVLW